MKRGGVCAVLVAVVCSFCATLGHAQTFSIPDASSANGACDPVPFGGSSFWSNQRVQLLVRAAELGGAAGSITDLAFAACGDGTYRHATLRITLAHVPAGHALATDFAANLAAAGTSATPIVVLDQRDYSWSTRLDAWSIVGLERRFDYDGVRDLLIEVESLGSSFVGTGSGSAGVRSFAGRTRLVVNRSTAWVVSPQTGRIDNVAPRMQVRMRTAGLSVHGRGCNGLELELQGSAVVAPGGGSNTIVVDALGARAFAPLILAVGTGIAAPWPIDLAPLGLAGCVLASDLLTTLPWTLSDAVGRGGITIATPTDPVWSGALLYLQWIELDAQLVLQATSGYGRVILGGA